MTENQGIAEQTVVVILAAGKGTRMGRSDLCKVCFEIDSVPAVNRVITCFKRQRFRKFLVVVGAKAQQVLDVVGRDHHGNVLLAMGNKFIEEAAVQRLVAGFVKQQADVALLSVPQRKSAKSTPGHAPDDGETARIETLGQGVNPGLYLFRSEVFYQGAGLIDNDNAQGEYYITDAVRLLAETRDTEGNRRYRVRAVTADNPDWVQAFNSPGELLAIQDYVRRKKLRRKKTGMVADRPRLKANQYCTVQQWIGKIEGEKPSLDRWFQNIYGRHEDLHRQKRRDLLKVLRCYGKRFGLGDKVCIVRAPGRINLMGRHVDHRGGLTNFLAIHRETLAVVGLRDDNNVVAVNTEPRKFRPVRFNISELIGRFAWSDWVNFVSSDWVRSLLYSAPGDWGNCIKAAVLRLQHRYQDVKIRGLNLALCGDVPIAAGLSSSSTIVVATLQAAIALNSFELTGRPPPGSTAAARRSAAMGISGNSSPTWPAKTRRRCWGPNSICSRGATPAARRRSTRWSTWPRWCRAWPGHKSPGPVWANVS